MTYSTFWRQKHILLSLKDEMKISEVDFLRKKKQISHIYGIKLIRIK